MTRKIIFGKLYQYDGPKTLMYIANSEEDIKLNPGDLIIPISAKFLMADDEGSYCEYDVLFKNRIYKNNMFETELIEIGDEETNEHT